MMASAAEIRAQIKHGENDRRSGEIFRSFLHRDGRACQFSGENDLTETAAAAARDAPPSRLAIEFPIEHTVSTL